MDREEAMQVFDGLMLGGGELLFDDNREVYFYIVYSDYPEHPVPFEARVASLHRGAEALRVLGVEVEEGYPKVEPGVGRNLEGETVRGCILKTKAHSFQDKSEIYRAG